MRFGHRGVQRRRYAAEDFHFTELHDLAINKHVPFICVDECALTFAVMGKARRVYELLLPLSKSNQVARARKRLEHMRKYVAAYKGWRLPRVPSGSKRRR